MTTTEAAAAAAAAASTAASTTVATTTKATQRPVLGDVRRRQDPGLPCARMDGDLLPPQAPQPGLHDYHTHISESGGKVKENLKELGCWQADPRVGQGVKEYAPAPGRGVEVMNWHNLRTSFHRWNPDAAPMPEGAVPMWRELRKTHEMTFTDDKSILWNPASWIWGETPGGATWYISGVCSERTQKVRTRQTSKQSQQQQEKANSNHKQNTTTTKAKNTITKNYFVVKSVFSVF